MAPTPVARAVAAQPAGDDPGHDPDRPQLAVDDPCFVRLHLAASAQQISADDLLDDLITRMLEPPPPPYRRATLHCARCGTSIHRYARTVAAPKRRGYVFMFGCEGCFKLRRHGFVSIFAGVAASNAHLSVPDISTTADVSARAQELVMLQAWELPNSAMVPGVPEALQ